MRYASVTLTMNKTVMCYMPALLMSSLFQWLYSACNAGSMHHGSIEYSTLPLAGEPDTTVLVDVLRCCADSQAADHPLCLPGGEILAGEGFHLVRHHLCHHRHPGSCRRVSKSTRDLKLATLPSLGSASQCCRMTASDSWPAAAQLGSGLC